MSARTVLFIWAFVAAFILVGCNNSSDTTTISKSVPVAGVVELQHVFPAISFNRPLAMVQAPLDNSRWYVIEQAGRVYAFDNSESATTRDLLLDISDEVDSGPGEAGLLGIALDPDFQNNSYVYLSYTSSDDPVNDTGTNLVSRISRFTMDSTGAVLDANSEHVILSLDQPYNNHNGGNIAFGPDGYLYIGFGDGGNEGDPNNIAQNLDVLLGKMLRIDVNVTQADIDSGITYKIPPDNPFASSSGCDVNSDNNCRELFAWGLRNPWRWSFDRQTGDLWAGDVGQDKIEEVDLIESGGNYGWRCYEGLSPNNTAQCTDVSAYTFPIAQYTHSEGEAVTGGYVYRGTAIPALAGVYLYADFYSGYLWGLSDPYGTASARQLLQTGLNIPSFAQDNNGEVYVLAISGEIYQLVPKT